MYKETVEFIRDIYATKEFISLHQPYFDDREKQLVLNCVESSFVSSVGEYVNLFEAKLCEFTGAQYSVAVVNGTNGLHIALLLVNVQSGDEVLTQPLTFIATANAIKYSNAYPVFIDIDLETLSLSPQKLQEFLEKNADIKNNACYNKITGRKISVCVPMHTFGHPAKMDKIVEICHQYHISVVEDAAESLGSFYNRKHTGLFGDVAVLSFNGNKIITTGGGGALLTNNKILAQRAKHLTTQAKVPHPWEYIHDEIGYNYRMPNLNAALGCAQLEKLPVFVERKRALALKYKEFFDTLGIKFFTEPQNSSSNYWLNSIILDDKDQKEHFLKYTNDNGVMTRPVWKPMHQLDLFKDAQKSDLKNTEWIADRLVNIPSWVTAS